MWAEWMGGSEQQGDQLRGPTQKFQFAQAHSHPRKLGVERGNEPPALSSKWRDLTKLSTIYTAFLLQLSDTGVIPRWSPSNLQHFYPNFVLCP